MKINVEKAKEYGLTSMQASVLLLESRGLRGVDMAAELGIQPGTVAGHRSLTRKVFGLIAGDDVVAFAVEHGILEDG